MRVSKSRRLNKPQPFPEGTYLGQLEVQPEEDWYNDNNSCNVILYMRSNKTVEGDTDVGDRPKRQSITVVMNGEYLSEVEDTRESDNFILARSGDLLASLAVAVGAVDEEDDEADIDVGDFLEELRNGEYDYKNTKSPLVFEVTNRKASKKARDPSRIYDDIQWFMSEEEYYEENEDAVPPEDDEEPEEAEESAEEEDTEEVEEADEAEEEEEEEEEEEKPAPKKRARKGTKTARASKKTAKSAKSRAKAAAGKARGRGRKK